jgi:hypothetical protein
MEKFSELKWSKYSLNFKGKIRWDKKSYIFFLQKIIESVKIDISYKLDILNFVDSVVSYKKHHKKKTSQI